MAIMGRFGGRKEKGGNVIIILPFQTQKKTLWIINIAISTY